MNDNEITFSFNTALEQWQFDYNGERFYAYSLIDAATEYNAMRWER